MTTSNGPGPFDNLPNPVEDYFVTLERLNFKFEREDTVAPADFDGQPTRLYDDTIGEAFGNFQDANNFFFSLYQTLVPSSGRPPLANFEAKESWQAFLEAVGAPQAGGDNEKLEEIFTNHFKIQHGIPFDASGDLGDFEVLYQALGVPGTREEFLQKVLDDAMTLFLTRFTFTVPDEAKLPQGGPDPDFDWVEEFTKNVRRFFTARAGVDVASFPLGSAVNLSLYQRIFNEFVPQPPIKPFEEVLREFYNDTVASERFFLPSHHLGGWMEKVQQRQAVESGTELTIAGTNSGKTIIIMQLLALLVQVIDTLQNVAAAQGERLQFYAGIQRAYTDLIAQVPTLDGQTLDDIGRISDDDKRNRVVAGHFQASAQAVTETLRQYRSIAGDEANQHQTSVNQSNEIVQQQTQLGTTLLQQLSSILTNMFK
jgi:hypothetical protein